MNNISEIFYSLYSNATSYPFADMDEDRIISKTTLLGLGILAISAYALRSRCPCALVRATSPTKPNLVRTFQRNYQTLMGKTCPSMKALEAEPKLVERILTRWTLDSSLHFFDLLGLEIYDEWRRQSPDSVDLQHFCEIIEKLSAQTWDKIAEPMNCPVNGSLKFATEACTKLKILEGKIPEKVRTEFSFLLKILNNPPEAIALLRSPVELFERTEVLDGDHSQLDDIRTFLDFARRRCPELIFIATSNSDKMLSQRLGKSILKNLNHFKLIIKKIVDYRLLGKKIPTLRLVANLQNLTFSETHTYKCWFHQKISAYLGNEFMMKAHNLIATMNKDLDGSRLHQDTLTLAKTHSARESGSSKLSSDDFVGNAVYRDGLYVAMAHLARDSKNGSLYSLEREIIENLDHKKKDCSTSEEYAVIFSDMVRLYQIAHDIRFLKDVTSDQLEGRHIPDSFSDRAFWTNPAVEVGQLEATESMATPDHSTTPSAPTLPVITPSIVAPKVKVKTHKEKSGSKEEKGEALPLAPALVPPTEGTEFPTGNVSRRIVMRLLLNNGFIIMRTTGGHYQMEHVATHTRITVPYHDSFSPGTLSSIREAFNNSQGR